MKIESKHLGAVVALAVCVITFFAHNEVITPDIMESRNIITAREMVHDGNWLIPTMNGELRLEKPPLPTWIAAVAEIVAPDNISIQRGAAGLAALLLALYFWLFARRILRIEPIIPLLLLCTCYNVILMGRTASWDIYCHAFMMAGIYHLAQALEERRCHWGHFIAAGVYTGLSIMSKGPVSPYALFLPFLISYILFFRPRSRGKGLAIAVMVIVALAIGSWWYVYVHTCVPDAISAVVQKETGSWVNHNVRPWWYYWKFFLETGVWSLLLLTAIFLPMTDRQRRSDWRWLFPMGWMLLSLILLSLMPEKKSRYLLPLLIPASYVMASLIVWWNKWLRPSVWKRVDRWCFGINAGLIALVVLALPAVAWIALYRPGYISMPYWIAFSAVVLVIAIYLITSVVQMRPMWLLWGVALLFLATECFFMPCLTSVINNPEMKSVKLTRDIEELRGVPFYHDSSQTLRIELVYAAGRKIRPLDITDTAAVAASMPCALLTHNRVGETLPDDVMALCDTTYIGLFDDNRRPRGNRRYSGSFIYHITLLTPKETPPGQ